MLNHHLSEGTSEPQSVEIVAHGCKISVCGNRITVKDGLEEITAKTDDQDWEIKTYILGQIHCILLEYTPAQLAATIKKTQSDIAN